MLLDNPLFQDKISISDNNFNLGIINHSDVCPLVSNACIICFIPPVKYHTDFELKDLIDSLDFTHNFNRSNRYSVLFGMHEYKYSNVLHYPKLFVNNVIVYRIFNRVCDLFPSLEFNSALLNYYPDSHAVIGLHADDEPDICNNSFILTLSLGGSRTLTFAHKHTRNTVCSYFFEHGEFIIFSKSSQFNFVHGILDENEVRSSSDPRLSITFRKLINVKGGDA